MGYSRQIDFRPRPRNSAVTRKHLGLFQTVTKALNAPSVLLAATATGTAGAIVFALLPILIGQIATNFELDDAQLGFISSAYFSVYSVVALTAPLWIRRYNWRVMAAGGFVILLVGLFSITQSASATQVATAMAIAGAGAAVLLPISLTLVAEMHNKDRVYGIVVALQQLVPTVLLFGISGALLGEYELSNTIGLIAAVVVIMLLLSFALPNLANQRQTRVEGISATPTNPTPAIVGLIGLALNFAGFAAMWTFLERIAAGSALDQDYTAGWIAVGLCMTVLGPMISAVLANRLPRAWLLGVPTLAAVSSLLLLTGATTPGAFAVVLIVFPLTYYITLSFILGVIADTDPNGRVQSLMSFALACGALVGPGVFGAMRATDSATALVLIAVALIGGIVLLLWVDRTTRLPTGVQTNG